MFLLWFDFFYWGLSGCVVVWSGLLVCSWEVLSGMIYVGEDWVGCLLYMVVFFVCVVRLFIGGVIGFSVGDDVEFKFRGGENLMWGNIKNFVFFYYRWIF